MFELLLLALFGYTMFNWGRAWQAFLTRRMVKKLATENNIDLTDLFEEEDQSDNEVIQIHAETVDDIILLYNSATNEFLGQGKTFEEAAKVFNERKHKATGIFLLNDKEEIYIIDGKLTRKT
jgi:hypothetical protein